MDPDLLPLLKRVAALCQLFQWLRLDLSLPLTVLLQSMPPLQPLRPLRQRWPSCLSPVLRRSPARTPRLTLFLAR